MAAHGEVVTEPLVLADHALELHRLVQVHVQIVHDLHIKHAEVVVRDLNDRLGEVKGGHGAVPVVLGAAALVLQEDVRPAVHHAEVPLAQEGLQLRRAAVKDDHVRRADLLHHQLAHILGIDVKGVGVHHAHDLVQNPVVRQAAGAELLHGPHAVELHQDLGGLILLLQLLEIRDGKGVHIVGLDDGNAVQGPGVIGYLPLLTGEQQRPLPFVKPLLQNAIDELGLPAVQEAHDHIDRDLSCHRTVLTRQRGSSGRPLSAPSR